MYIKSPFAITSATYFVNYITSLLKTESFRISRRIKLWRFNLILTFQLQFKMFFTREYQQSHQKANKENKREEARH